MPRGSLFNFRHAFCGNKTASLGKWFEPAFECQRHPFQQTAVRDVRKRMPVQHAVEIRLEAHASANLPESAKEDSRVRPRRAGCKVLGIARVAEDCIRRDVVE
jgi:hypothetical protein